MFKGCKKGKTGNLILASKIAYGTCSICAGNEHFSCSNTKDWRKLNIINGKEKYHCTNCYAKHHKNLTLQNIIDAGNEYSMADVEKNGNENSNVISSVVEVVKAIVHNTESLMIEDNNTGETLEEIMTTADSPCEEILSVGETVFKCDLCSETFISVLKLSEHKKTIHEEFHKCEKCTEVFLSDDVLKVHFLDKHQVNIK